MIGFIDKFLWKHGTTLKEILERNTVVIRVEVVKYFEVNDKFFVRDRASCDYTQLCLHFFKLTPHNEELDIINEAAGCLIDTSKSICDNCHLLITRALFTLALKLLLIVAAFRVFV